MFLALILIHLALFTRQESLFKENYEIETQRIVHGKVTYHGIVLFLGTCSHNERPEVVFYFDLGINLAMVGDANSIGFGIDCLDEYSCKVEDKPAEEFWYQKQPLVLQPALTHLATDEKIDFHPDNRDLHKKKLPLRLVVGPGPWLLEDWGAIGLGPNSDLATYLKQFNGHSFSFIPYFRRMNDNSDFRLIINPVFDPEAVATQVLLPQTSAHWEVQGNTYYQGHEIPRALQTICISTASHEILLMRKHIEECFKIHKIICDGRFGSHCTPAIAKIYKAPKLLININEVEFQFDPEDYLVHEGQLIKCRFGEFDDLWSSDGCGAGSTLAIGNGFFEKYPTVFRSSLRNEHVITFLSTYDAPVKKSKYFRQLVGWGIFMTVAGIVTVAVIIWRTRPKPRTLPTLNTSLRLIERANSLQHLPTIGDLNRNVSIEPLESPLIHTPL